jgi:hypothetical protein
MSDIHARNNNIATCLKSTSGTISILQAVYPVSGDGEVVTVELAKSDASGTMPSIGIAAEAFTEAEEGAVVFSGILTGIDTSSWSAGDELWVSSVTAGALTSTQPQGVPEEEKVGQVLRSHATGGMLLVYNAGSVAHTKESGGDLHTPTHVGLANVTNDAQLKRSAGDVATFTEKATPVSADLLLIEDSAASNAKKKVQVGNLPGGGTASDNPVVKARRTTTYNLTTSWVDITLDTTDIENDTSVVQHNDTNTDRIDLKEAGLYEVYYQCIIEEPFTAQSTVLAEARVRVNDSTVVTGSESQSTVFEDDSIPGNDFEGHITGRAMYVASANDYVTLQLQYTQQGGTGDAQVIAGLTVEVKRLSGQKGDTGAAGADGDITWEGAWSSSTTYAANEAVSHEGSSYVCIWDVLAGASTAITNDIAEASGTTTTTSSSFTSVNSMTLTPASGTYLVWLRGNWKLSAAGTISAAIYAGGTQESCSVADDEFSSQTDNLMTNFATLAKVTVNGSQAIEGRWKVTAGTGTMEERQLLIMRVG